MNATFAPADTKTRILDAAERVFSQDGFDAASLRIITTAAQVNLAAVNYHFHSKEALFSAVIERRIGPINQRRIELLDAIQGKPTPEKILEAFLRPPLELTSGGPNIVLPLMARLHLAPNDLFRRIMEENFAPLINRFIAALQIALPDAPRAEVQWRMFFVIGSMSQALLWAPLITLFTEGENMPIDTETLAARLISFGAAGLKASPTAPRPHTNKRVTH